MNQLYSRDVAEAAESTFDLSDEHTMSPLALPSYCSMKSHDNATNPQGAPTPASVGGTDPSYYPDNGQSCLSPLLLQNSPTTSFYDAQTTGYPEDQNASYSSESNYNHSNESASPDTMDAGGYMGYIGNPAAASPQMYGAVVADSSSPWQANSNSWPTETTASTATQPFMLSQPNPCYEVGPQYDTPISPGNDYLDPASPSTALSAESSRKKKRSHRRSSGNSTNPMATIDGTGHQHRTTQLRTAQRSSKYSNSSHKPAETVEERKARAMHNQVEQQYRKRLNSQFERLLAALPPEDSNGDGGTGAPLAPGGHVVDGEDRRVSKAEVLDRARQRIKILEKERMSLERQKRELMGNVGRLRDEWSRGMGGGIGVEGT